VRFTLPQARRIALAAQGFAAPRPAGPVTTRHLRKVIDTLAIIQLDSVNVFSRTHYLPFFSRLGPYDRELLDRLAVHTDRRAPKTRELFEYWAHEASLVRTDLHPYLRWRMASAHNWGGVNRIAQDNPQLLEQVRAHVAADGPLRANAIEVDRPTRRPGEMWSWDDGKVMLEYLFWTGEVSAARRVNFERHYDLSSRVLPPEVLAAPTPTDEQAYRELVRIAARAYGIATEPDLGDYFRLPRAASKQAVAELVGAGELLPAAVDGWRAPAYLWPSARVPRRVSARALLSPFDPLLWFRDRTSRLFGFEYRIEIYVPAAKRQYGYYVLPFLLGDRLVARVDLKSDRQAGVLRVQGAYLEPGHDQAYVAAELAAELETTAVWLGLSDVVVAGRGDLSGPLGTALGGKGPLAESAG